MPAGVPIPSPLVRQFTPLGLDMLSLIRVMSSKAVVSIISHDAHYPTAEKEGI